MRGRVQRKEARQLERWGSERDKAAHLEVHQFNMENNEEVKEKLSEPGAQNNRGSLRDCNQTNREIFEIFRNLVGSNHFNSACFTGIVQKTIWAFTPELFCTLKLSRVNFLRQFTSFEKV